MTNFRKIADKKEDTKTRDYLLKNKRLDSLSIEDIEDLQDVTTKEDFMPDLIDKAHKDFVVVLNSYDPLNGAIFNHKQRQNFIRKLVSRPVTTQITNYKLTSSLHPVIWTHFNWQMGRECRFIL